MFEHFEFHNYSPSYQEATTADGILGTLTDLAPSDSTVNGSIDKVGNSFECTIDIVSCKVHFNHKVAQDSVEAALEAVSHDIEADLSKWRKERFNAVLHS